MAMRVHDMTVFLALWLFLLGLVNVQANLGSYSLYAPKISPKLDKDLDALLEFHSEGLKDRSTCGRWWVYTCVHIYTLLFPFFATRILMIDLIIVNGTDRSRITRGGRAGHRLFSPRVDKGP